MGGEGGVEGVEEEIGALDIWVALDVEQLDTHLFRSRSLYLPYRAWRIRRAGHFTSSCRGYYSR